MRERKTNILVLTLVGMTGALAACSGADDSGSDDGPGQPSTSNITTIDEGSGVFASQVDATAADQWVYMDLAARAQVEPGPDPADSTAWDIAFRRSNVKVNGGYSGTGGVEVTVIATDDWSSIAAAPVTTYETDQLLEDADPEQPDFIQDDNTDFAFGRQHPVSATGWFNYDFTNHVLSAADVVYAVRARDGQYYKVRFLDYYDQAGTSGFPTLRYARIDPPDPATSGFVLDASDRQTPVYFDLATRSVVTVADPALSTEWDLRILRTSFATNSGESGPGLGGAQWGTEATFFSEVDASRIGFARDERVPPPGPPVPPEQWIAGNVTLGEWFDYDEATMTVSPKAGFFVLRGADGESFYSLKIFVYDDGVYRIDVGDLGVDPAPRTFTVDAKEGEVWTYVDLRRGEVVAETASTTAGWDVAFSRTRVRTNSGTSGPGQGGAVDAGVVDFDAVREAPTAGYQADEMVSQGRPGETPYSGNDVLGAWFDYDPSTNTVTPRATVFSVRLADGTYAKLRFDDYDDGIYTLTYAYAGVVGVSFP